MTQDIWVYIILAAAILLAGYKMRKPAVKTSGCSGCSGCDLKDKCEDGKKEQKL